MAPDPTIRLPRVRSGKERRRKGRVRKATTSVSAAATQPTPETPSDVDAQRKAQLEYKLPESRRKMKYVGEIVTKAPASRRDLETIAKASGVRRRSKATRRDSNHSHRGVPVDVRKIDVPDESEFVYAQAAKTREDVDIDSKTRTPEVVADSRDAPARSRTRRKASADDNRGREERRRLPRRQSEPVQRRNSYDVDECAPVPRKSVPRDDARSTGPKSDVSAQDRARATLHRITTSSRSKTDTRLPRSNTAPEQSRKASSIFSRLLPRTPVLSEKKISCLTCGADDVLISRSAKLACSHRMCHECLRRIFTMSVTDPAHMPPRCCTSEHIPLKHVDKLFDQNFKKTWNRKFQEYTTRNKVYCPARGCGEWIKPSHITVEHGRKVGKCKRCNTRVCCTCNNKLHTSRECPKDPAIKEFVEIAKEKGWQKCYSCSAMVELKEGCNHMTCRCTAEFCMICGLKWKSCDCPWFNYETIDAHLGNPVRYQEELDRRREQEQRDEALAWRLQAIRVEGEDYRVIGAGNAAGYHMDDDFIRNIPTGNFRHARPAAEGLFNDGTLMGIENLLPLPRDQTTQLQQQSQRRRIDVPLPAPLLRR